MDGLDPMSPTLVASSPALEGTPAARLCIDMMVVHGKILEMDHDQHGFPAGDQVVWYVLNCSNGHRQGSLTTVLDSRMPIEFEKPCLNLGKGPEPD